ncbi:hypothetical protein [Phormidesmis sp. 146-33]
MLKHLQNFCPRWQRLTRQRTNFDLGTERIPHLLGLDLLVQIDQHRIMQRLTQPRSYLIRHCPEQYGFTARSLHPSISRKNHIPLNSLEVNLIAPSIVVLSSHSMNRQF